MSSHFLENTRGSGLNWLLECRKKISSVYNDYMSSYMSHITVLRGLAILAVVLFHLNGDIFSSGYLGVDVFFVISGYLLFRGVEKKPEIEVCNFLSKRIVRIVPSLAVTVFITLFASCFVLNTETSLGSTFETGWKALLGYSNYYLKEVTTDYFATAANLNPLLHTWYLSVTLQLYLLWAVITLCFKRLPRQIMWSICAVFALLSFVYAHSLSLQDFIQYCGGNGWGQQESISYYDTGGRIWEVFAGGLVLLLPCSVNKRVRFTIVAIGLISMAVAFSYNEHMGSELAVLLTVFATIILLKYMPDTIFSRYFACKPVLSLGQVSFSWYLIHFPVFVLVKIATGGDMETWAYCAIFVCSLLMAYGMWYLVESRKFSLFVSLLAWLVCSLFACLGTYTPYVERVVFDESEPSYPVYKQEIPDVQPYIFEGFNREILLPNRGLMKCMGYAQSSSPDLMPIGDAQKTATFVVIGDSNAQHLYSGLNELALSTGISGVQLPAIILPFWNRFIETVNSDNYLYDRKKAEALLHWLASHPELKTVFIGQLWDSRLRWTALDWDKKKFKPSYEVNEPALVEFCKRVAAIGKQIVLVAPTPRIDYDKKRFESGLAYMRWRCKQPRDFKDEPQFVLTYDQYKKNNKVVFDVFSRLENAGLCRVLHLEKGMFPDGEFRVCRGKDLYMRDPTHITPLACIALFREVKKEFVELLLHAK